MGCSYAKCLFDPPVHRCCSCCPPCLRMGDLCCGNKNLPEELLGLPENDGYVVELTTKSGATTHMWCHERPSVRTSEDDSRFDLIYSHGRLEDITFPPIRMFLRALSRKLKINCYLYEFVGFYRASGEPSEAGANEAIEAALAKVASMGTNNHVLLMGHSLGCGPTVHLASQPSTSKQLAGVILKSTFTSVCAALCCPLRLLCCCCAKECHQQCCASCPACDTYRNIDLMPAIQVPVLVMHSEADKMIDHENADLLSEACQEPYPVWKMKEDGHAAFPKDSKSFFAQMASFLEHCEARLESLPDQMVRCKPSSNAPPEQLGGGWEDLADEEQCSWFRSQPDQHEQLEPDTSAAMEPAVSSQPVVTRDDPQEPEYEVEGDFGLSVELDPELAVEIPEEIAAEDDDVAGLTKREFRLTNSGEGDEK